MKKATPAADPESYVATLTGWQRARVEALRAAVRATRVLEERIKWGHLVYQAKGPVCLIRAEEDRVLFGFWRGQRLRELEPRLKPGGKYEMATLELRADVDLAPAVARRLVREALQLNLTLGDPTHDAPGRRATARSRTGEAGLVGRGRDEPRSSPMPPLSASEIVLPLRIVLLAPPAGVRFALQKGASTARSHPELVEGQTADGKGNLVFNLTVRARLDSNAPPRLLGPFAHGPPAQRFVYITVGQSAGQPTSPWNRRAKIPLAGITAALVKATVKQPGAWLEAAVPGTLKDGSPTCATRPFAPGGDWRIRA